MEFEELEAGIRIDQSNLDEELILHVDNYYEVCKGYRKALDKRDYAKNELKEIYSELQMDIRDDMKEEHGKARVTEAMVEARILLESSYRSAIKELQNKDRDLNSWLSLKAAYEQRAYALRDLIELFISGYFGVSPTPKVRENLKDKKEHENIKQINSKRDEVNDKLGEDSVLKAKKRVQNRNRQRLED